MDLSDKPEVSDLSNQIEEELQQAYRNYALLEDTRIHLISQMAAIFVAISLFCLTVVLTRNSGLHLVLEDIMMRYDILFLVILLLAATWVIFTVYKLADAYHRLTILGQRILQATNLAKHALVETENDPPHRYVSP